MAIVVDNKFSIGDTVYVKTDPEQFPRIVFCFIVYRQEILYELACGVSTSKHYDFELSLEKNILADA